jgi:hypothetical protein
MKILVPAVLVLLIAAQAQAAQLYRWVDAEGHVHYTDKQPPKDAKDVEKKRVSTRAGDVQLPYEVRRAAETFPVTLFSADCGEPCDAAKKLLEGRGVPFKDRNARDAEVQVDLKILTGGTLDVPVLQVGRSTVKGWEAGQWNNALDAAGYPRTASVRPPAPKKEAPRKPAAVPPPESGKLPPAAPPAASQ